MDFEGVTWSSVVEAGMEGARERREVSGVKDASGEGERWWLV